MIDLTKYKIKEIIHVEDNTYDEYLIYLTKIIQDRTISEESKTDVRNQLDIIYRYKSLTMKPPTIVLEPIDTIVPHIWKDSDFE